MATAVPKEKAVEIIEELNMVSSNEQIDGFTIARYKHEAEKLKTSGYLAEAFIILGMIACLEGDEEKMHASHRNAISYAPTNPNTTRNYAVSLLKVGQSKEAYKYFLQTYKLDPTDKRFLNDVIETLYDLSVYDSTFESDLEYYAMRWVELTGENHSLWDDPEATAEMLNTCDTIISETPEMVTDVDSDIWSLAEKLTKGIELGK